MSTNQRAQSPASPVPPAQGEPTPFPDGHFCSWSLTNSSCGCQKDYQSDHVTLLLRAAWWLLIRPEVKPRLLMAHRHAPRSSCPPFSLTIQHSHIYRMALDSLSRRSLPTPTCLSLRLSHCVAQACSELSLSQQPQIFSYSS